MMVRITHSLRKNRASFFEDFPDRGPCQVAEIAQAFEEANAGDFASENDVAALREKLGAYAR